MEAFSIDTYECPQTEAYWEILRADGDVEVYTVVNDTYTRGRSYENLHGLRFHGHCGMVCDLLLNVIPTDLRYNGAKITGVIHIPECFSIPNVTDTATLNIQGIENRLSCSIITVLYLFYRKLSVVCVLLKLCKQVY